MKVLFNNIPAELRALRQWVLWKLVNGRKVPMQTNGRAAKTNDPTTWASFAEVFAAHDRGGFDGIGFVFSKDDPFVGIDIDGCRHPTDGVEDWARRIIERLASYTEISPSGTGVHVIVRGKFPSISRNKMPLPQHGSNGGKEAAVEVYDHGRYFCITGHLLEGIAR